MNDSSESPRRNSRLALLTYALLLALAAMSALTLYLVEARLVAAAGQALALAIIAGAVLPLGALLLWSAHRLHLEWARAAEREQWLATTLREIADGVICTDAGERVTFLNPTADRVTGWTESAALGQALRDVLVLEDRTTGERIASPSADAIGSRDQAPRAHPVLLAARDGARRTVTCDATVIRRPDGAVNGCVIVIRDVTDRELADTALQASQEMFATITDHISDMIAVLDLEGRRLYTSASYARVLAPPGDLYLTDSFADVHPDDRERIKQVFAETVRTGVGQRTGYRLLSRSGEAVFIESLGSVIRGADGRPERVLVVSRDDTERHRAEEQLRQEKEFSENLIHSMPGVFYLADATGRLLRWNRNLERMTGYTAAELAALPPLGLFPAEQRQLVESRFAEGISAGRTAVETFVVLRNCSRVPVYVTGVRMEVDGEPCLLGLGIDISERLQAEEAVRATMRRLGRQNRALSEYARSSAIAGTPLEQALGQIAEISAQTLEVGRSSIWLYNETGDAIRCADLYAAGKHSQGTELAARDYPAYFAALAEERAIAAHDAATDPRTREFASRYLAPLRITSMLDAPIRSGGKMIGVVCNEHTGKPRTWTPDEQNFAGSMADLVSLSVEVHQRKQAEAALREAHDNLETKVAERTHDLAEANERLQELDRLKSEFLATMSHELRTPLNSIIGFTGILRQGLAGPLNDEQLKQLGMVHFSARHLLALINDLLDLSRIESGKMEVVAESFPLEEVVGEVVQSLTPTALQKKLTLETALNPPQLNLQSDRKKIFQILLNLTNNALKFTERGQVRITSSSDGEQVTLTVIDTGIGIRPESIGGLFQAFRQVDGSARRVYEGTGLGLYLCKKLSTMLGGNIRAESELGVGSRFTVTLPLTIAPSIHTA